MFDIRPYNKKDRVEYNPFREMDELERAFFGRPFGFFGAGEFAEFKTDIKDLGDSYLLESDLPGFDKKDITLDIDGDILTVKAERKCESEQEDKKQKYVCRERSYGSYTRQFDISAIEADGIKAKYENGVLKLTLPKKSQTVTSARHLEIE